MAGEVGEYAGWYNEGTRGWCLDSAGRRTKTTIPESTTDGTSRIS